MTETSELMRAMANRRLVQTASGQHTVALEPGEGEFVCAACDSIHIATRKPVLCSCGSDRIETLTAIRVASPFGAA